MSASKEKVNEKVQVQPIEPLTSIVEYSKTAAALATLRDKYEGVLFDVTTKEGRAAAINGRAELRGYRVALEKVRVEIKAPALTRAREIDTEAKRITQALTELETPIDDQIKADERKKAAELQAKIDAENERIAAEEKARKDAEERVLAAQRAEIERQNQELVARRRAQEELEAAARRKIDEEQREAREKIEAEKREAQRILDERAEKIRQEQAVEAQRVREAQDRVDAQRREVEERERMDRDAEEARLRKIREEQEAAERAERAKEEQRQREYRRKENERLDGRAMLVTFRDQFGKVEEFAPVVAAINKYLKSTTP